MDWTEWVLIYALVIGALANFWFIALVRHKDHKEDVGLYREQRELYRKSRDESQESIDQVHESNRIRSEEVALLRELVAELRAARQAQGPPSAPGKLSN